MTTIIRHDGPHDSKIYAGPHFDRSLRFWAIGLSQADPLMPVIDDILPTIEKALVEVRPLECLIGFNPSEKDAAEATRQFPHLTITWKKVGNFAFAILQSEKDAVHVFDSLVPIMLKREGSWDKVFGLTAKTLNS